MTFMLTLISPNVKKWSEGSEAFVSNFSNFL